MDGDLLRTISCLVGSAMLVVVLIEVMSRVQKKNVNPKTVTLATETTPNCQIGNPISKDPELARFQNSFPIIPRGDRKSD